jgi:LysM repeat protein
MQRAPVLAMQVLAIGVFVVSLMQTASAKPGPTPKPRAAVATYHTVYQGQTLGMIAKRYNVSVEDLCSANAITRRTPIKPGQKLALPGAGPAAAGAPKDVAVKGAASVPRGQVSTLSQPASRPSAKSADKQVSWKKFVRPARRAGYVTLKATGRRWEGYAVVKGNRLAAAGQIGFKRALYSWRTGAEASVDPRLIRLLVKVSDTFGGRALRIVSGFRENSFARASKHKRGQACDFSVEGVPNEVLRDYLLTLGQVGVGYYPNSSFVHLDVRPVTTQWIDHSSPGQRPEYEHHDDD